MAKRKTKFNFWYVLIPVVLLAGFFFYKPDYVKAYEATKGGSAGARQMIKSIIAKAAAGDKGAQSWLSMPNNKRYVTYYQQRLLLL